MGRDVPLAYFAYQGINQDAVDHVRVLGNNTFGFEDLFGGGDMTLTILSSRSQLPRYW
jgi:hypothetical protein